MGNKFIYRTSHVSPHYGPVTHCERPYLSLHLYSTFILIILHPLSPHNPTFVKTLGTSLSISADTILQQMILKQISTKISIRIAIYICLGSIHQQTTAIASNSSVGFAHKGSLLQRDCAERNISLQRDCLNIGLIGKTMGHIHSIELS